MHRRFLVALAVAVLTAGCGGSGELSRTQLVQRANAACRHRTTQLAGLRKRYGKDFEGFVAATIPVASTNLSELKALHPPANLKRAYDRFLAGQTAQVEQARAIVAAQRAGRTPARGESVAERHELGSITRSLGLQACA